MADYDFSLKSLIRTVSDELIGSQKDRVEKGLPALFEVEEFNIEVSFVVTENRAVGGGFDLKIVKADAGSTYDSSSVHKISLKMKALSPSQTSTDDDIPQLPDMLPLRIANSDRKWRQNQSPNCGCEKDSALIQETDAQQQNHD